MKEAINFFRVVVRLSFEIGIVTATSIKETCRFEKISDFFELMRRYLWINLALNFLSLDFAEE